MKNIIFIAPPAAGKGTQSEKVTSKYDYEHISTGDMLREEIASGSTLGLNVKNIIDKGQLVTDDIMIDLIKNKLNKIGERPFILDGFPRTYNQAIALNEILDDNYVAIYLQLDKEIAMNRTLGRITCKCGRSYSLLTENLKPKKDGVCDSCGEMLLKRNDDNAESFSVRYDTFLENNSPIIEFYQNQNKLNIVDASMEANDIFKEIEKVIK